jgi:hypothetical protein
MTKFVTPKGVAVWPHLNKPDTKFNAEGEYTVKLRLPAAEATGLIAQLEKIRDDYKDEAAKQDPKVARYNLAPVYDEEVDDQGNLTGNYLFKFKQKAIIKTRKGDTLRMKVALFDAQRQPTSAQVGGGSIIKIAGVAFGYAMPTTKMVGVSLRPEAVQIIELQQRGGNAAAMFDVEDGYVASGDDGFVEEVADAGEADF